jgi:hypothetical protein
LVGTPRCGVRTLAESSRVRARSLGYERELKQLTFEEPLDPAKLDDSQLG